LGGSFEQVNLSISGYPWGIWAAKYDFEYEPGDQYFCGLGYGEFTDNGLPGELYFTMQGEDTGDGRIWARVAGISRAYENWGFYIGKISGGYGSDFGGIGMGIFYDEYFFESLYMDRYEMAMIDLSDRRMLIGTGGPGSFAKGGDINVHNIFGGDLEFYDMYEESLHRGLMYFDVYGEFEGPVSSAWTIPIAGHGYRENEAGPSLAWLGKINGTGWEKGTITGNFGGFWFSEHDTGEGYIYSAGTFGNASEDAAGEVIGNYIEGEEYRFEAMGVGEWVEVTDLLSASTFELVNDFVTIPITEVHSAALMGGSGSFIGAEGALNNVMMDISFYSNELGNVWAALLTGNYSGDRGSSWQVGWEDGSTLNGTNAQWNPDGTWRSDVSGSHGDYAFDGEVGGTYGDGNFQGAGAGEWQEGLD